MSRASRLPNVAARDLVFTLLVAAAATPALLFAPKGEPDPLAVLVWVTLLALPGGYACGARRIRLWPLALVVPVGWMMVVASADALSARDLPAVAGSALPIAGLFGVGFALAGRKDAWPWRGAAALWLVGALLAALPLAGLVLRDAWPARVAARVLDLAPTTLVAESAGVDWMRQSAVYDGSSTVDIDPNVRTPYQWRLAGVVVFVVGCAGAIGMDRARRNGPKIETA